MSVARTANDVTAAYTTQALVEQYLPSGAILAEGETAPNCVTTTGLAEMIADESREIDGELGTHGFMVPFPAVTASDPSLPSKIVKLATFRVVAEVRSQIGQGNRKRAGSSWYEEKAEKIVTALIERPSSIGRARKTTPDDAINTVLGTASAQYGKFTGIYYRLKNRNIYTDTIRWVTSAGVEVAAPDGRPFAIGVDWQMYDNAQGILVIPNSSQIIAAIGASGGCVYEFSWVDFTHGQAITAAVPGVSLL